MSNTHSKVKTISEDTGLSEAKVATVLYSYLAWCCEEVLIDGKSKTIFGEIQLNNENELELKRSKFGLIDLLGKTDMKIIRKIIEHGSDFSVF